MFPPRSVSHPPKQKQQQLILTAKTPKIDRRKTNIRLPFGSQGLFRGANLLLSFSKGTPPTKKNTDTQNSRIWWKEIHLEKTIILGICVRFRGCRCFCFLPISFLSPPRIGKEDLPSFQWLTFVSPQSEVAWFFFRQPTWVNTYRESCPSMVYPNPHRKPKVFKAGLKPKVFISPDHKAGWFWWVMLGRVVGWPISSLQGVAETP